MGKMSREDCIVIKAGGKEVELMPLSGRILE